MKKVRCGSITWRVYWFLLMLFNALEAFLCLFKHKMRLPKMFGTWREYLGYSLTGISLSEIEVEYIPAKGV